MFALIGKELVSTRPATISEVAEIMEKRAEDGELGFEQQATSDYAKEFKRLPVKKAGKLVEELVKNEKIKDDTAVKIADLMPKNTVELNLIIAKERFKLEEKEIQEVLKIVDAYR